LPLSRPLQVLRGVLIWLLLLTAVGTALMYELRTVTKPEAEMKAAAAQLLGAKRVVAVIAHPDDAEYWISGTLAMLDDRGARVVLVVASDGEKGRDLTESNDIAATRRAEQVAAGAVLGYDEIVFLGQPDRAVADGPDVQRHVEEVLQKEGPDLVITFDGFKPQLPYLHPDHEALGRLTQRALTRIGYRGAICLFHTRRPDIAVDITPVAERKVEAMRKHVSQNGGQAMRRRTLELFRALQK
jgi:LmbE family N-acetylglucosaminyl deacetylase